MNEVVEMYVGKWTSIPPLPGGRTINNKYVTEALPRIYLNNDEYFEVRTKPSLNYPTNVVINIKDIYFECSKTDHEIVDSIYLKTGLFHMTNGITHPKCINKGESIAFAERDLIIYCD